MTRNAALLAAVIAAHAALLVWLAGATGVRLPPPGFQRVTTIEFVVRRKPRQTPMPAISAAAPSVPNRQPPGSATADTPAASSSAHAGVPASDAPRTHAVDGRVLVPQQALDAFLRNGQSREFDLQRPGLDDMDALLKRPVALEYRATRFEAGWQGDRPRLERVLETAVEKTTATVKIPVPGRPGAFLQCKLAVLAASGGCGFTANDDGYFVAKDDPDTLSPEEERQCRAWWDLIVSAKTQSVWRRTRTLYEQECRKPLAKIRP